MNSFTQLKQVIDSLESQIDDNTVSALQEQLSRIEGQHSESTGIGSVIKRMQSIGRYLGSKRDNAHEETLPVLHAITIGLERLEPDLDKEQTDDILRECSQLYASLKTKIASRPLVTAEEIQALKAVILEVDWEISDAALETFDQVTSQLLIKLKSHKILHAFLKIIHSMGRYIASRKARAHKDSIFFLHSVFENFERVVQTPGMPFQEKKQLIKRDITAFNEFKREISTLDSEIPAPAHTSENENLQPALSHVRVSHTPAAQDVIPLHQLSEQEKSSIENPMDSENIIPALAGKKRPEPEPRDVMDELFTMKESPADQLLDAIHLSAIQGPHQKAAMNMNEPTQEDLQKQGIKNFTPTRMDNEPIPEIGNRLDEFFDMDIPALETNGPDELQTSLDLFPQDVIPIEDEEASAENSLIEDDLTQGAINRLKSLTATQEEILEPDTLTAMEKDLAHLKTHWQDDPDKTMLLDSLAWLTRLLQNQISTQTEDIDEPDSEILDSRPQGFWGKIKSLFIS